jgi:CHAT domain-containing protein/tetratricopeptide (TPR) repeat protein
VMIKLFAAIFFSFLTILLCAQTSEYEQLKFEYERFRKEQKLDSVKLVAKEMNRWALIHEGDTSLRYAVSFRYIGNGFSETDSSLFYYQKSIDVLRLQGREFGIDLALSLYNNAVIYKKNEDFFKALEYYLNAFQLFKVNDFIENDIFISCVDAIGDIYALLDMNQEALFYYQIELLIVKKSFGQESPEYLNFLNLVGKLYQKIYDFENAELCLSSVYEIRKKSLGKNHRLTAISAANLANLFSEMNKYDESEKFYLISIEIVRKIGNVSDDLNFALILNNIGLLYTYMGQFDKSEYYLLEAFRISHKHNQGGNSVFLACNNNIGLLYQKWGKFNLAEEYFQNVISLFNNGLSEEYDQYATSVNNLANLYADLGDYQKARPLYIEALSIRQEYLGEDHPDVATSMEDIGMLHQEMGDYALAERYYFDCKNIINKTLGENHTAYANILQNIGNLYRDCNLYEDAKEYFHKACDINRLILGDAHPDYALSLCNLGNIYSDLMNFSQSEFYYCTSLQVFNRKYKDFEHPEYFKTYMNLANLYAEIGEFKKAEYNYFKALDYCKGVFGVRHKNYIIILNNIANLYLNLKDYEKAEKYLKKSNALARKYLRTSDPIYIATLRNFVLYSLLISDQKLHYYQVQTLFNAGKKILQENLALSTRAKEAYKDAFQYEFFRSYNSLDFGGFNKEGYNLSMFNFWLLLNNLSGNSEGKIRNEIAVSNDTSILRCYNNYLSHKYRLNRIYGLTQKEFSEQGIVMRNEIEAMDMLERTLSSGFDKFEKITRVYQFSDISSRLLIEEAYIDIIQVPYYSFDLNVWTDSSFYMAYLVTSERQEVPLLINLGDGKQIDEIIYPYLVGQTTNPTSTTMDGQVYNLLWKPLEQHLLGKTKIYLSPGGIYHSINPETIYHAETGKYLFEEKEIHLVNSGRSFVDQRIYGNRSYTDKSALIMGAPNFDYSYVADSTLIEDNTSFTYQTMRDLSLDGNRRITPLPATCSEVEGINQTLASNAWNTQLFTDNDALEMNLRQMDSPRILHIATHGYFLEDIKLDNDNGMRMMGMDVNRVAENPMLRSGLLLAGCNKTLADNTPLTGGDNGILTAYEAGLLDLSKTELVVLSACETGKGEILNGEGVQGLRKAMTDAGAENILMSLWKVDDKVTSEYMQTFYVHYAQCKSIRESYNLTRNEIKQKYPQPYYWGAFVLVGD